MFLALSCATKVPQPASLVEPTDAVTLVQQIDYLTNLLLPPIGATRHQSDRVYGRPAIYHCEPAKNLLGKPCREYPPSTYRASYLLLGAKDEPNARVILYVTFVREYVTAAHFQHRWIPGKMFAVPNESPAARLNRENTDSKIKYEDILALYKEYGQRISKEGGWHAIN